jgi:hypothetical protein
MASEAELAPSGEAERVARRLLRLPSLSSSSYPEEPLPSARPARLGLGASASSSQRSSTLSSLSSEKRKRSADAEPTPSAHHYTTPAIDDEDDVSARKSAAAPSAKDVALTNKASLLLSGHHTHWQPKDKAKKRKKQKRKPASDGV